jgi:hypothetical protein
MTAPHEALHDGYGGISRISRACGLSRVTITKSVRELDEEPVAAGRIRRPGAGRHKLLVRDPEFPRALASNLFYFFLQLAVLMPLLVLRESLSFWRELSELLRDESGWFPEPCRSEMSAMRRVAKSFASRSAVICLVTG